MVADFPKSGLMVCNIFYDKAGKHDPDAFVVYTKQNYSFEYDKETGKIKKTLIKSDSKGLEHQS